MAKTTTHSAATEEGISPSNEPLRPEVVQTRDYTARFYSLAQLQRARLFRDLQDNPDEVIRQFGGPYGVAIYFLAMRTFGFLMAPITQLIDLILSADRAIVAGDPNDDDSLDIASQAVQWWQSIPNKEIVLRRLCMAIFIGFYPVEKVWGLLPVTKKDSTTGDLIAVTHLFDVPPQNLRFDRWGNPRIINIFNLFGTPVPKKKLMIFRCGSVSTPYGEGLLKYVYPTLVLMQQLIDFGLEAVEQLGRPMPVVYVPRNLVGDERAAYMANIAEQFKAWWTLPTDEGRGSLDFPGQNVTAGGTAGRAEQEWLRYLETWCVSVLLSTAQTGDRGGAGNGKLEEQRGNLKSSRAALYSDALDECLTLELLHDICEANWSHIPRSKWPRFKSDATEVSQAGLTGVQAERFEQAQLRLAARHTTETGTEEMITSIGLPRARARKVVSSIVKERDRLVIAPDMTGEAPAKKAPITNEETSE